MVFPSPLMKSPHACFLENNEDFPCSVTELQWGAEIFQITEDTVYKESEKHYERDTYVYSSLNRNKWLREFIQSGGTKVQAKTCTHIRDYTPNLQNPFENFFLDY